MRHEIIRHRCRDNAGCRTGCDTSDSTQLPDLRGEKNMAITVNLYYTGKNGNARRFAQEMESSGTADAIRAEDGNLRYEYFCPMNDPETEGQFIRK